MAIVVMCLVKLDGEWMTGLFVITLMLVLFGAVLFVMILPGTSIVRGSKHWTEELAKPQVPNKETGAMRATRPITSGLRRNWPCSRHWPWRRVRLMPTWCCSLLAARLLVP